MSSEEIRFEAITAEMWPRGMERTPVYKRQHGRYKAPWSTILHNLQHELDMIGAKDVVIQLDCPQVDIRKDGYPKGDARVRTPGVVLRFTHPKQGPVIYPSDHWTDWQDNVRAISLTLEALRAVERHRVGVPGQQYAGYRALPASVGEVTLTKAQAADVLAKHSGVPALAIEAYAEVQQIAVRKSMDATHPDKGGDGVEFDLVKRADRVLTEARGGGNNKNG